VIFSQNILNKRTLTQNHMPVKTESISPASKSAVMQGRWGKSLTPPSSKGVPAQRKGKSVFYLGKSVTPPDSHPVQQKSDSKTEVQVPTKVQRKMEGAFGSSFSNVKVYKDSAQAKTIGAQAFTQGNEVHFAQGKFDPNSSKGQELLGHELTHVEQQRAGRVSPTTQAKGIAINNDPSLEREADVMGAKAARGEKVSSESKPTQMKTAGKAPIQASMWSKIKKGAKKVGGAIVKGAKKVGGAYIKGAKAIGKGLKAAGKWLKDKKEIIAWIGKAAGTVKAVYELVKLKKWSEAYQAKAKLDAVAKPPSALSKVMGVISLVLDAINFIKAVLKINKGIQIKKGLKEVKPATNDKEKTAKEVVAGIQNIRITIGAANATDAILNFASGIMTLAGVATAGIGAIVAVAIKVVQLVISGGKLAYNLYRKHSAKYKEKVKAQNEAASEGFISLKDAKLYSMIGMKYDEAADKSSQEKQQNPADFKDSMKLKMSAIKNSVMGKAPEMEEVDKGKQKQTIIDHLNKEREDSVAD
jgi:hypothetical protein